MLFDLPQSDQCDDLDIGIPTLGPYPALTEWKPICSCMGCDLNYIPKKKTYFLNHWKVTLVAPLLVSFIIISSFLVYMIIHRIILRHTQFWVVVMTLYMLLFITSYIMIIIEGPGFLPYYYPLEVTPRRDGKIDYLSGVVTTQRQMEFVEMQPKMDRVRFFKSVGRFVIRPDHLCGWTGSFIGQKNHKLFFLFNFWGCIYIFHFFIFSLMSVQKQMTQMLPTILQLTITIVYILLALFFLFMTGSFAFTSLRNFTLNLTQFELMSGETESTHNNGIRKNFEEIFGPLNTFYLWLFPIGAFHGVNPARLARKMESQKTI